MDLMVISLGTLYRRRVRTFHSHGFPNTWYGGPGWEILRLKVGAVATALFRDVCLGKFGPGSAACSGLKSPAVAELTHYLHPEASV